MPIFSSSILRFVILRFGDVENAIECHELYRVSNISKIFSKNPTSVSNSRHFVKINEQIDVKLNIEQRFFLKKIKKNGKELNINLRHLVYISLLIA